MFFKSRKVANEAERKNKPEWLIKNAKDGTLLGLIPEGVFIAGGHEKPAKHYLVDGMERIEPFSVRLPGYYLALHCVTNTQYARILNETLTKNVDVTKFISLCENCRVRFTGDRYESDQLQQEHPVVCVSWYGAVAYCSWAGLRLPSELEWEKGARGADGRKYPWGEEWDGTKCRHFNHMSKDEYLRGPTSEVWGYAEGNSPHGMYQMSGNVWEWCDDWFDVDVYTRYKTGDLNSPAYGDHRVVRGGQWTTNIPELFNTAFRQRALPDESRHTKIRREENEYYGFRCARSL